MALVMCYSLQLFHKVLATLFLPFCILSTDDELVFAISASCLVVLPFLDSASADAKSTFLNWFP